MSEANTRAQRGADEAAQPVADPAPELPPAAGGAHRPAAGEAHRPVAGGAQSPAAEVARRTVPDGRGRYPRGEGAQRREDILDAAARLLVETGDEAMVTIRAVAAAVGVSPPSVYLHFPDKDTLIFAVCQKLFTALDDAVEAATQGLEHPLERLKARGLAYARFGVEHPEEYRVIFMQKPEAAPEAFGSVQLMESAAFGHLLQNVVELLATGELRPELEPFPVAIECWAVVHGCTSLLISHPTLGLPPIETLVGDVCDHLALGMLAQPPSSE